MKFGEEEGGWCAKRVTKCNEMGVWTIRKWYLVIQSKSCFIIGDARRVKFWKDILCNNLPFEKTFLSLFSITSNKDSLGSECVGAGWEGGGGNLPFSRWFNDWELVDIYLFPL